MGGLIAKTKNLIHGDSVSDISVNPRYYEWATSCHDGHVRVFRHTTKKSKTVITTGKGGGVSLKTSAMTPQAAPLEREKRLAEYA